MMIATVKVAAIAAIGTSVSVEMNSPMADIASIIRAA